MKLGNTKEYGDGIHLGKYGQIVVRFYRVVAIGNRSGRALRVAVEQMPTPTDDLKVQVRAALLGIDLAEQCGIDGTVVHTDKTEVLQAAKQFEQEVAE